jgi:hypothetical protein
MITGDSKNRDAIKKLTSGGGEDTKKKVKKKKGK